MFHIGMFFFFFGTFISIYCIIRFGEANLEPVNKLISGPFGIGCQIFWTKKN